MSKPMTPPPIRGSIVPEPILRAHLDLFSRVILRLRCQCFGEGRISDEELFDLMDALHNIPVMLMAHGSTFTHEETRPYLVSYDQRWGRDLTRILDESLAREEQRTR